MSIAISNIITFLRCKGFDHRGRSINQLWALPDWRLEKDHDFIQWMFPTDFPSNYMPDAPVLTTEDIAIIKIDKTIQDNLTFSLERMIRFYEKNDYWITEKNHNFLRITRILRFLWLAGRVHDYCCFQRVLDDYYIQYGNIITNETYAYWKYANDDEYLKAKRMKEQAKLANPYDRDDGDFDESDLKNFS